MQHVGLTHASSSASNDHTSRLVQHTGSVFIQSQVLFDYCYHNSFLSETQAPPGPSLDSRKANPDIMGHAVLGFLQDRVQSARTHLLSAEAEATPLLFLAPVFTHLRHPLEPILPVCCYEALGQPMENQQV